MAPERFTFFWDGPFSQWHKSTFTVDGKKYVCAEQYMMAAKARLFGDKDAERMIMATGDPKEQKRLGRQVQGFNEQKWNSAAKDIVYKANYAKFSQHDDLRKLLLATAGTTLVEASPYDTIWGIGLPKDDPRAQTRSQWKGKNWLGEVLTKVRDDLLADPLGLGQVQ